MRSVMLAAGAAVISAGPAMAQAGAAGPQAGAQTLGDLERKCRSGDRQACQEADRLRAQVQSGLEQARSGRSSAAGGSAATDPQVGGGGGGSSRTQPSERPSR
jgi:hypothetical protein